MKKTPHKDLIIGKIYEDLDPTTPQVLEKTVLEYVGEEGGSILFKYHSGDKNTYTKNKNGLYEFTKDGVASFWESPNPNRP